MPKSADSDSSHEKQAGSRGDYSGDPRWTLMSLDEIAEMYWAAVAPDLRAEGFDAESHRPTHEWLVDNGYRQLIYALTEHHETTFTEFWNGLDRTQTPDAGGYDWDIRDEATRESMQQFIDRRLQFRENYAESTAQSDRYRLARYARTYYIEHGTDDLLTPVSPESDVSSREATDRAWAALDRIKTELDDTTAYRIYSITQDWYEFLISRERAEIDPTSGIGTNYGWNEQTPSSGDPSALADEHVKEMYAEAASQEERLLVVGLCAWGLRLGELAALHEQQLHFQEEPYIAFSERKNGPSTVNMVYGDALAKERIAELDDGEWNGYLLPSNRSQTGHRNQSTLRKWFHDLADRAGVPERIDGDKRKPHMGRRFWYSAYASTLEDVLDHVGDIAEEQGSTSADVVWDSYLSDERKRALRRQFMRERLASVFEI